MIVAYTEEKGYSLIHVFRMGTHHTEKFVPYYFEPDPFGKSISLFNKSVRMVTKMHHRDVGRSCSPFSYEADILFPHRWILDRVKSISTFYSYLCVDIENKLDNMPKVKELVNTGHSIIMSIALRYYNPWLEEEEGVILYLNPFPGTKFKVKKGKADRIIIFETESSMLIYFNELVDYFDPDILTGWHSDGYDYPYLLHRMRKLKIPVFWGRLGKKPYFRKNGHVVVWGRALVDAQTMYRTKRRGTGRISWRLEYISELENLDQPKTKLPGKGSGRFEEAWKHYPDEFANYNYHDVLSASELFDKDINMYRRLQQVVFGQIDRLFSQNQVTSSILLRVAGKMRSPRQVLPTSKNLNLPRIQGAEVFDPIAGYFEDVYVPDYISYYPNIIKTYNMSTETVGGDCRLFNGHSFNLNEKGLLPEAVDYLLKERFENKKIRDTFTPKSTDWTYYHEVQNAYKTVVDGMYGAMKNNFFRLACREVPESITYIGREGIKMIKRESIKKGHTVLRGDTDGVAMILGGGSIEDFVGNFRFEDFIGETCMGDIPQEVTIELGEGDFYPKFYSTVEKKHYFYYDENNHFGQKGYFKADLPRFAQPYQTLIFKEMLDNNGRFPQEEYEIKRKEFYQADLEEIGFPRKFPGGIDFKKSIAYAEELLDLKYTVFDRPLSFAVKSTGSYKHIEQIIVNDPDDIPNEFEIDRKAQWNKLNGKALGDTINKLRSDLVLLDW